MNRIVPVGMMGHATPLRVPSLLKEAEIGAGVCWCWASDLPRAEATELILVVEDDEAVRETAVSTLRELGYRVAEAGNAQSAMEVIGRTKDVRLLFTDLVMPGVANGYQLAQEAKSYCPDLMVLYTSAYGGDVIPADQDAKPFLRKPYRDYELAHAVRAAMKRK